MYNTIKLLFMTVSEIKNLKKGDVVILDDEICAVIYCVIEPGTPTAKDFDIEHTAHPNEYWFEYFAEGGFTVDPIHIRKMKYIGSLGENIRITNFSVVGL